MPKMKQATNAPKYPYCNCQQRAISAMTYLCQGIQDVDMWNIEVGTFQGARQDDLNMSAARPRA
jgi:hypothetical protein